MTMGKHVTPVLRAEPERYRRSVWLGGAEVSPLEATVIREAAWMPRPTVSNVLRPPCRAVNRQSLTPGLLA